MTDTTVPDYMLCPITQEIMESPFSGCACGRSFEGDSIKQWLTQHNNCPLCKGALTVSQLKFDRNLKEAIDDFKKRNPQLFFNGENMQQQPTTVSVDSGIHVNMDPGNEDLKIGMIHLDNCLVISVDPPKSNGTRRGVDICLVIDVSGSMQTEAIVKGKDGKDEGYGLSILDIVGHAAKTVIKCLGPNDRLGIVTFSTTANTICGLTKMDDPGKNIALDKVRNMRPEATTNLWDGLLKGMEMLKNSRNSSIFLLTDGCPNVNPPRGEIVELRRFRDRNGGICPTVNMFGFGYNLESELLMNLAREGSGTYTFIPDGGMVGTVFVNAISNTLSTFAKDVILKVQLDNGQFEKAYDELSFTKTTWGGIVNVGNVQYDQSRSFVFQLNSMGNTVIEPVLEYKVIGKDGVQITNTISTTISENERKRQTYRMLIAETILLGLRNPVDGFNSVKGLISASDGVQDLTQKAMLEDVRGQITEALSNHDYFTKWGRHYLRSLCMAYLLQQCNNFKDPGVQIYGGPLFKALQDMANDIFNTVPPPTPSVQHSYADIYGLQAGNHGRAKSTVSHRVANISSMSTMNSSYNPCFSGDSIVHMPFGKNKRVDEIKKCDMVICRDSDGNTNVAQVICVVETDTGGTHDMVNFDSGLSITPWHPMIHNGKWCFPCDVKEAKHIVCPKIYSFVLDNHHTMIINDTTVICLGHGTSYGILKHSYWGTQKVIDDLKKCPGWNEGHVKLGPNNFIQDENGVIGGMKMNE